MLDLAAGRLDRVHLTDWLRHHLRPLAQSLPANPHDERTGRANASTRVARSCCSAPGGSRRLPEESDASSLIRGIIRSPADQVWTRAVGELW